MKIDDKELQAKFNELIEGIISFKGYSHDTFKQLKFREIKKGYIECQMEIEKSHCNSLSTAHGGLVATLTDGIGALCFITTQDDFQFGFTINLNVNYISSAQIGETIICKSQIEKITKTLAFVKCSVERLDGSLLATANIIFKVPPKSKL